MHDISIGHFSGTSARVGKKSVIQHMQIIKDGRRKSEPSWVLNPRPSDSEVGCTVHIAELDVYVDSLFHCLHDCACRTLPKLRASSSCVPGWNRAARILKDKANFWFIVWKSSGVLFQIKRL